MKKATKIARLYTELWFIGYNWADEFMPLLFTVSNRRRRAWMLAIDGLQDSTKSLRKGGYYARKVRICDVND